MAMKDTAGSVTASNDSIAIECRAALEAIDASSAETGRMRAVLTSTDVKDLVLVESIKHLTQKFDGLFILLAVRSQDVRKYMRLLKDICTHKDQCVTLEDHNLQSFSRIRKEVKIVVGAYSSLQKFSELQNFDGYQSPITILDDPDRAQWHLGHQFNPDYSLILTTRQDEIGEDDSEIFNGYGDYNSDFGEKVIEQIVSDEEVSLLDSEVGSSRGVQGDLKPLAVLSTPKAIRRRVEVNLPLTPKNTGRVAVIIDEQNFRHMIRINGVEAVAYHRLMHQLNKIKGGLEYFSRVSGGEVAKPVMVIPEYFDDRIGYALKSSGFYSHRVVMTYRGADDAAVKKLIRDLTPEDVDYIILVSGDGGYYPELQQKLEEGIDILVMATETADHDGRSPLSPKLEFPVIEVADFISFIAVSEHERRIACFGAVTVVTLAMHVRRVERSEVIIQAIERIAGMGVMPEVERSNCRITITFEMDSEKIRNNILSEVIRPLMTDPDISEFKVHYQ